MAEIGKSKQYDLEGQTLRFAEEVIMFVESAPRTIPNIEVIKQLTRAAGSIGANYIEANEALGKKDFIMRVKICRKESKESQYWLKLIKVNGEEGEEQRRALIQEATELMKIFGSILEKSR